MSFRGAAGGAFGCSGGLVVASGVEDQFAEELAGGGVDDPDVEVLDEQDDAGSGVGSADADVVESAVVAQGHAPGAVDDVVADPDVGVAGAVGAGSGLGQRVVDGGRGRAVGRFRERWGRRWLYSSAKTASRALSSVMVAGCVGWARSHFFIVCWNRSTFPQVVGWLGREFFWTMPRRRSSCSS